MIAGQAPEPSYDGGVSKGTNHKNVRVDTELWDRAKWIFETRGTTISAEIRDFLQRSVDAYEAEQDGDEER